MIWLYFAICFVALGAGFAMTVSEGLWHNTLLFCYLLISSAVAFGYYQPLTIMVDEATKGELTYIWDMVIFWALFAVTISLLKAVGRGLSGVKVKFLHPVEQYAGPAMGFLCGVVLAGLVGASFHLAPLHEDCLGGAVQHEASVADAPSLLTGKPDIAFLALSDAVSAPSGMGGRGEFLPGAWVDDYAARRKRFEEVMSAAKSVFTLKARREESR